MLPALSSRLIQVVLLSILAIESAHATFGHSTSPHVKSGESCGIGWDRGGGGGGDKGGGDDKGNFGGGGGKKEGGGGGGGRGGNDYGGHGGGDKAPELPGGGSPDTPGGGRPERPEGGRPERPEGGRPEIPEIPGGGWPKTKTREAPRPGPSSTDIVGGGIPGPLTTPIETPPAEDTDAIGGGSPSTTSVLPSLETPGSALAGAQTPAPMPSDINESNNSTVINEENATEETNVNEETTVNEETNLNNTTNVNNVTNINEVTNLNSTTNINESYEEWKSTSITLMITIDYKRIEVAEIAVNVDISAQAGEYEVPQAPWLSCAGESFYYRFTSSKGTVTYTEEFTIEGKDSDLTKSCVEEKAPPKVVESPKGNEWKALNNQTFGYTIIQNVTNIINQVITTVINGVETTKTVEQTVTVSGEGATVTETAKAETVYVTNMVTEGGLTVTSVITSVQTAAATPAVEPAPPVEPVPDEPAPPTPTDVVDDEWDDEDWEETPISGTASYSSGSASATATGAFDDDWEGFGTAPGRPQASIFISVATATLAMLAGAFLLVI